MYARLVGELRTLTARAPAFLVGALAVLAIEGGVSLVPRLLNEGSDVGERGLVHFVSGCETSPTRKKNPVGIVGVDTYSHKVWLVISLPNRKRPSLAWRRNEAGLYWTCWGMGTLGQFVFLHKPAP